MSPAAPAPGTADSIGWAGEESIDIQMVAATCPKCAITLIETNDDSGASLNAGVATANALGAKFVSMSWGSAEDSTATGTDAATFAHPGVVFAAATGDAGYQAGVFYPASSPDVVAVGGTTLNPAPNARGWVESAWGTNPTSGAQSGCSSEEAKPSWQSVVPASVCTHRATADVSAVGDPSTGVAVYQTYGGSGWTIYGGTSVATPIITAVYALAGTPSKTVSPPSLPYAHRTNLNDVTSGHTGTCAPAALCTAGVGWDGPTGLGTPIGVGAFSSAAVTVTNPGAQTGVVGKAVSLSVHAVDVAGKALTYSATGLPSGLSSSAAGLISGTPTVAGSYPVVVTAKDTAGSSATTSFTWTIAKNTVTVTNPGAQTGAVGKAVSLSVHAVDAAGKALTYSATGLPTGLSISASGLVTGTPTLAGAKTVVVTVRDAVNLTATTTFTWTIASSCSGQKLLNPGFESGSTDWTTGRGVINTDGAYAHTGNGYAWLDGYGAAHTDTLSQAVAIPAGCAATLSYYLEISSDESATQAYDTLVLSANGTPVQSFSNVNQGTGYVLRSVNLSSYAGKTVTITWTGTEDASLATSFIIDDTALTVSPRVATPATH